MIDERFPRRLRVTSQADFDRVRAREVYAADTVLVVAACENECGHARLGVSVSRKVGNAVVRNRWKRLVREVFRRNREALPSGIDYIVRPRRGATPDFAAIRDSLPKLAARVARQLRRNAK